MEKMRAYNDDIIVNGTPTGENHIYVSGTNWMNVSRIPLYPSQVY